MSRVSVYQPEFATYAIDLLSEGASICEIARELGIDRATFYRWCDPDGDYYHEDFAQAVALGRESAQGWWEKQGRIALRDKSFNSVLWFMNMKNRFPADWRDRHDLAHTGADGQALPAPSFNIVFGSDSAPEDMDDGK